MMDNVIYIIMGIFYGGIYSILFIRMDETWKKIISVPLEGGLFGGIFLGLNAILGIDKSYDNYKWLFGYFVISFFISFILIFIITGIFLAKEDKKYKIRVIDIILGYNKLFEDYYNNRQKEIDDKLDFDKLNKQKDDLEKREQDLEQKENIIKEQEEVLLKNEGKNICIMLPEKNIIPIDNSFLKQVPYYVEDLSKCIIDLERLTEQFINSINNYENKNNFFIAYLLGLSKYILNDLFNSRARLHIRYLDGDSYEKLIACNGINSISDNLTSIKYGEGMIYKSIKLRRSLIKSINHTHHKRAKNDDIWQEYISFAFYELKIDGKPALTIGISFRNRDEYINKLYFLNFCKFETIIQNQLMKFNEKCEIIEIIKNIHKKEEENMEAI